METYTEGRKGIRSWRGGGGEVGGAEGEDVEELVYEATYHKQNPGITLHLISG